jgi:hypothetical protein
MKSKRMPYFPMFAADWLLSQTVATMAPEEQGIYISLLAHAWMNDGIPADHRKLLRQHRHTDGDPGEHRLGYTGRTAAGVRVTPDNALQQAGHLHHGGPMLDEQLAQLRQADAGPGLAAF